MVNVKGKVCPVLGIILIKFLLSRAHVNQECKWFGHSTLDIYDPFQRGIQVVFSKKLSSDDPMFGMIFDIFTVSLRRKFDAALNVEGPFSPFSTLLITLSSSIFDLAFVPLNQS